MVQMKNKILELKNEETNLRDLQRKIFKNEKYFNKCKNGSMGEIELKIKVLKGQLEDIKNDNWIN